MLIKKPQRVWARIVPGHRVASGLNANPLFPGGTIRMQAAAFLSRGLDLRGYHSGTLNVSVAPLQVCPVRARLKFRGLAWHPTEPAEDFSFFDVCFRREGEGPVAGLIYYPHPETKPTHFQQSDVLELLMPFVAGLSYGDLIELEVCREQLEFKG
jgi:hypothetical protein